MVSPNIMLALRWAIVAQWATCFLTQYFVTIQQPITTQQRDTFQQSSSSQPSCSFQQPSNFLLVSMIARMLIFLGLSFFVKPSCDYCTTFARQSHDVRENVVRRSMVINLRNFIGRTSCECRKSVMQHSPMIRAIIVRHSCDCRK